MIDLEKLERLAKAATPGPWDNVGAATIRRKRPDEFIAECTPIVIRSVKKLHQCMNNADYIVAACNAVPELIAENRKFQECMRELERQNDFFLKALKENFMCPYSRCKYDDGSELDEWECDAENNRECWIKAAKEAGE